MNKFAIFVLGAICGFGVSHTMRDSPSMEVVQASAEAAPPSEVPLIHRSEEAPVATTAPETPHKVSASEEQPQQSNPPHPVYFIFSEETVENMEQNIATLQKDVSVIKEQDGWVVRFHSTHNLLSQLGISDNDLIRFNQLDEMRLNPDTQDLANRMESVLANLER